MGHAIPLVLKVAPLDTRGRALTDLRISVVDRCNFRCPYCMPEDEYPRDHEFLSKAERLRFTINLVTPDNGEKFIVEMENATLTNIKGFQAAKPDLTLTINRSDLEQTMMGAKTLDAQLADGTAKAEGDVGVLQKLAETMVDFDPRFEIMPGTKAKTTAVAHAEPYQAVPERIIAE